MGALTETEIFDCMRENFRIAIRECEELMRRPVGGKHYDTFRKALRLIEGCCKQANCWREDTRWLPLGKHMADIHQKAGDFLRGIKGDDGIRRPLPLGQLHPAFQMLTGILTAAMKLSEQIRTQATGRIGMILPDMLPAPHRDTRPAGWNRSTGGILIPEAA